MNGGLCWGAASICAGGIADLQPDRFDAILWATVALCPALTGFVTVYRAVKP